MNRIKEKVIKRFEKEFEVLHEEMFIKKLLKYLGYGVVDIRKAVKENKFNDYGLTVYAGRQGSGKSISMTERLEQIRRDYPDVKILTNYGYVYEDDKLDDWQKLVDVRSDAGVVFAIDEIQNEFDVYDTRNFNLEILKVITQQRKQGIKILATSQIFSRVSKPLREQTFEVVECNTLLGRWTFQKAFDADDYNLYLDNPHPEKMFDVSRKWKKNFIQSNRIRTLFDSYAVIESMKKLVKQH